MPDRLVRTTKTTSCLEEDSDDTKSTESNFDFDEADLPGFVVDKGLKMKRKQQEKIRHIVKGDFDKLNLNWFTTFLVRLINYKPSKQTIVFLILGFIYSLTLFPSHLHSIQVLEANYLGWFGEKPHHIAKT